MRDDEPATIDTSAVPMRGTVDCGRPRRVPSRRDYVGGAKPTSALSIRFRVGQPWIRVDDCPMPPSPLTWSAWTHTWRPTEPGRYQIVLRVDDGGRRLPVDDGLGLSLVRRIAEQGLGGEFRLSSRADGGTRAEVTFSLDSR